MKPNHVWVVEIFDCKKARWHPLCFCDYLKRGAILGWQVFVSHQHASPKAKFRVQKYTSK